MTSTQKLCCIYLWPKYLEAEKGGFRRLQDSKPRQKCVFGLVRDFDSKNKIKGIVQTPNILLLGKGAHKQIYTFTNTLHTNKKQIQFKNKEETEFLLKMYSHFHTLHLAFHEMPKFYTKQFLFTFFSNTVIFIHCQFESWF